mgnify:FL=1
MMSLLKRYVLRRFVYSYLLSAAGLIGIFLSIDFFERVDEFVSRDMPMSDLVFYYIYKVPYIAFYMAPQAVLLATVITLAVLARDNEIVAMKACGIGVTGITLPIIGASLVIALLIVACNEYVMPITNKKMNHIFFVKVRQKATYGQVQREKIWLRAKDGAIWNIGHFDPENGRMKEVSVFFNYGTQSIQKRIDAAEVVWADNRWEFLDGYTRTFRPGEQSRTVYFKKRTFPVAESPEDFKEVNIRTEELSLREMYRRIQELAVEGKDTMKSRVELHQRLSYPFISIVLALLTIPLSLRSSRHGGVLFCVSVNMAMGFIFSFLYAMGISLGFGGIFNPALAAWGPILFFSSIGFYMILTLDSEEIIPVLKV